MKLKYKDIGLKTINCLEYFRYLYCDEINLEPDTVLGTLYAAKKYIVPHLARSCVHFLETSLTAKNSCLLLSQSRLFEEPELMQRCWEVIDAQVCRLCYNFYQLSANMTVCKLFCSGVFFRVRT